MPGARLPHAWIKFLNAKEPPNFVPIDTSYVKEWEGDEVSARTASTLDLCPLNAFSLITSADTDSPALFQALKVLLAERGIAICFWTEGNDFEFVYQQQKSLFGTRGNLDSAGAILVRPDQHILGTYATCVSSAEVESDLLAHLGLA